MSWHSIDIVQLQLMYSFREGCLEILLADEAASSWKQNSAKVYIKYGITIGTIGNHQVGRNSYLDLQEVVQVLDKDLD